MTDFEPEDQPLPALSRLKTLTSETTARHGLVLRSFLVDPNFNPAGPHATQIILTADPDWTPDADQVEDPEFERVLREAELAEQAEKAEKARESLTNLRDALSDRSKGIGLD